ncbi:MAG: hypothetical protein M3066_17255 [Actinomycetota bacterium]|nr:hypothetical protein [Actinomycetota bacterium]
MTGLDVSNALTVALVILLAGAVLVLVSQRLEPAAADENGVTPAWCGPDAPHDTGSARRTPARCAGAWADWSDGGSSAASGYSALRRCAPASSAHA